MSINPLYRVNAMFGDLLASPGVAPPALPEAGLDAVNSLFQELLNPPPTPATGGGTVTGGGGTPTTTGTTGTSTSTPLAGSLPPEISGIGAPLTPPTAGGGDKPVAALKEQVVKNKIKFSGKGTTDVNATIRGGFGAAKFSLPPISKNNKSVVSPKVTWGPGWTQLPNGTMKHANGTVAVVSQHHHIAFSTRAGSHMMDTPHGKFRMLPDGTLIGKSPQTGEMVTFRRNADGSYTEPQPLKPGKHTFGAVSVRVYEGRTVEIYGKDGSYTNYDSAGHIRGHRPKGAKGRALGLPQAAANGGGPVGNAGTGADHCAHMGTPPTGSGGTPTGGSPPTQTGGSSTPATGGTPPTGGGSPLPGGSSPITGGGTPPTGATSGVPPIGATDATPPTGSSDTATDLPLPAPTTGSGAGATQTAVKDEIASVIATIQALMAQLKTGDFSSGTTEAAGVPDGLKAVLEGAFKLIGSEQP